MSPAGALSEHPGSQPPQVLSVSIVRDAGETTRPSGTLSSPWGGAFTVRAAPQVTPNRPGKAARGHRGARRGARVVWRGRTASCDRVSSLEGHSSLLGLVQLEPMACCKKGYLFAQLHRASARPLALSV